MSELRKRLPFICRNERRLVTLIEIREKGANEHDVLRDLIDGERAKVVVRHEFKMRVEFLRKVGGEFFRERALQEIALDSPLLIKGGPVGEVLRRRMVKLPD